MAHLQSPVRQAVSHSSEETAWYLRFAAAMPALMLDGKAVNLLPSPDVAMEGISVAGLVCDRAKGAECTAPRLVPETGSI